MTEPQNDPRLDPKKLDELLETMIRWGVAKAKLGDGFEFEFQPYTVVNGEDKNRGR